MSMEQQCFLNPKPKEVQIATAIEAATGKRAMRKEAKRRINFWDGNINSHARCLNNEKTMQHNREFMALSSMVGDINRERQSEKDAAKEKKQKDEATKAAKKIADDAKLAEKKAELLPVMEEDVAKGYVHVKTLTNARLKELLLFYYNKKGMGSKNKPDLLKATWECMHPGQPYPAAAP
uniref:Uncharacterized protein n=1 Tax=Grammatophora oceanica TaxID=210454 RepID=A0A7S1Y406_9STRA|mmetsp:Transcript_18771/g.27788  ORF Transcript_18771/g.27788 Transcript_18771/m.27788 type:complete len:179 (+) Transcript_18771:269-805(+)